MPVVPLPLIPTRSPAADAYPTLDPHPLSQALLPMLPLPLTFACCLYFLCP